MLARDRYIRMCDPEHLGGDNVELIDFYTTTTQTFLQWWGRVDGPTHGWKTMGSYYAEWESEVWKEFGKDAPKLGGHGGIDFIMFYRLIKALREGTAPDMDVYDAAALSSITDATESSIANRSKSVDIPDFTRGAWKTNKSILSIY